MTNLTHAWLLQLGEHLQVAVGEREMIEYVVSPQLAVIPLAPRYCPSVMLWRGRFTPVINIGTLLSQAEDTAMHQVGIVAYQVKPRTPLQYLAIVLHREPLRITVDDAQVCALPEQYQGHLRPLIRSCFSHQELTTPILDIAYLCSAEFREQQEKHAFAYLDLLRQ